MNERHKRLAKVLGSSRRKCQVDGGSRQVSDKIYQNVNSFILSLGRVWKQFCNEHLVSFKQTAFTKNWPTMYKLEFLGLNPNKTACK